MATDKALAAQPQLAPAPAPDNLARAAMLILTLDEKTLVPVFQNLRPDEVKLLIDYIEKHLSQTPPAPEQLAAVAREFVDGGAQDASARLREATEKAFGRDESARDNQWKSIAERASPDALAAMLAGERPQAVAVVLAHLPPRFSADVLALLPTQCRVDAIERMAHSERVAPAALEALLDAIQETVAGPQSGAGGASGGVKKAAAMLSQLEADRAEEILGAIRERDAERAENISQQMFRFEEVLKLEAKFLQMVLAEMPPERIAIALKGASPEQSQAAFAALPEGNSKIVKEEIETSGALPKKDVQKARNELATIALRLEREGKIRLRADEDLVG